MTGLLEAAQSENGFLQRICDLDRDGRIRNNLVRRRFEARDIALAKARTPDLVYFPTTSVLSTIVSLSDGGAVDAGSVGREGCVCVRSLFNTVSAADYAMQCSIAGEAIGMPFELIRDLYLKDPDARDLINNYFQARFDALTVLSACSASHSVIQRSARLLLHLSACADRAELAITQELVSEMLGTRRASVSVAFSTLFSNGAIASSRRSLIFVNTPVLRRFSCDCIDGVANAYRVHGLALGGNLQEMALEEDLA